MAKLALAGLVALPLLAGCGRMGDPRLPEGVSDNYPTGYPGGAPVATDDNIFRNPVPREAR